MLGGWDPFARWEGREEDARMGSICKDARDGIHLQGGREGRRMLGMGSICKVGGKGGGCSGWDPFARWEGREEDARDGIHLQGGREGRRMLAGVIGGVCSSWTCMGNSKLKAFGW